MEFTAKSIALILNGKVEGDENVTVNNISKIEEGKPGTLAFLANPKYTKYIYETKASIVLINDSFTPEKKIEATLIRVPNAYESFAQLLDIVSKMQPGKTGIDPLAFISPKAKIGNNVFIGAFAYIADNVTIADNVKIYPQAYVGDNVVIDSNTIIYPGVKIYHECKIGKDCIIHASTVIGSDGFGFAAKSEKDYKKIPQLGNVIIEDDVEIGSNTSIDRATIGSTIIRKGVKLDNLIQIGHNVEVGENTVICSQVGISGSTKLGKECMIAGQVGFAGHLVVADGVKIAAQSGIPNSVTTQNDVIMGSPAYPIGKYRRTLAVFKNLPEMYTKISELEKEIKKLKEIINK